ncbi:MAG: DUF4011 domain-containing protein [Mycoplasmatales bacterium]|nr:DUF4011 domain-containing protein [Mycoplasmatales bacterium]
MNNILVTNCKESGSGKSVNFEYKNTLYTIQYITLWDYGISSPNDLEGQYIILNEKSELIHGTGKFSKWITLTKKNILTITSSDYEEEFKEEFVNSPELSKEDPKEQTNFDIQEEVKQNNNEFLENSVVEKNLISKIDFNTIYKSLNQYTITTTNNEMNDIDKLIEKSIKLTKNKYNNGTKSINDYNFEMLYDLAGPELEEFINNEIDVLVINAPKKIEVPKNLMSDKESVLDSLKERHLLHYSTKTNREKYLSDKMELNDFLEFIKNKRTKSYLKLKDIQTRANKIKFETGVNPLVIAWPYIKGKTKTGTVIHAPLVYTDIEIVEKMNAFEITKKSNFKINTYPILRNYVDVEGKVNELKQISLTIEDVLKEFFKHGIKINKPKSEELCNFEKIKDEDKKLKDVLAGTFELTNELMIKIKDHDEFINYDLRKIKEAYSNFSIPNETLTMIEDETIERKRHHVLDIDNSKTKAVNASLKDSSVIFGPPGTGKSESITAIIGEIIKSSKNSLLITEKSTAIEVVQNNLNKIGLGDFAINLNNCSVDDFKRKFNNQLKLIFSSNRTSAKSEDISFSKEWVKEEAEYYRLYKSIPLGEEEKYYKFIDFILTFGQENSFEKTVPMVERLEELYNSDATLKNALKIQEDISSEEFSKEELTSTIENDSEQRKSIITEIETVLDDYEVINQIFFDMETFIKRINKVNSMDSLVILIRRKKPLFINRFIKKNSKDLKQIFAKLKPLRKQYKQCVSSIETNKQKLKETKERLEILESNFKQFDMSKIYNDVSWKKENSLQPLDLIFNKEFIDILEYIYAHPTLINEPKKMKWEKHKKFKELKINNNIQIAKELFAKSIKEKTEDDYTFNQNLWKIRKHVNGKLSRRSGSIHSLFKNSINIMKFIFPCIMMNPELASQILPIDEDQFDYAIFDEASQIRLHKALPTIHRSNKVIVAGDNKQLGPTDLFAAIDSKDEDKDELDLTKDDSLTHDTLLNFAQSKYANFHLRTHYRSKAKELIKFSNETFYDNEIEVADTPLAKYDGKDPIIVEEINGLWTKERNNMEEAIRTIELIKHYLINQEKTLGVITFNDNQAALISKLIQEDEQLSLFQNQFDKLFVKPIKNVQGDERDVIIFSLAYGRNIDGKYVTNFGQFSKEKINVAITRSKLRMHILKSFPAAIVGRSGSENYRIFGNWLTFIEDQEQNETFKVHKNVFVTEFQKEYYTKLINKLPSNIQVWTNYNVGPKKIDIVLFDKLKNKFVGAIELDGVNKFEDIEDQEKRYDNQMYLESLGWDFVQVTPIDFYNNKDYCIQQNIEKLKLNKN